MRNLIMMKKMWVSLLTFTLIGLDANATQFPIPMAADSLEHFIEGGLGANYANGDTIVLTDPIYVVNGTVDLYQGVVIIGDPGLGQRPELQLKDNGFRFKQDSIGIVIKGINFNGATRDDGKITAYLVRSDNLSVHDSIFTSIIIEDCDAWSIKGGVQLQKAKWAVYDSVIINNCVWGNIIGDWAIDPRTCFAKKMVITNSTFYNLSVGFLKNPGFADEDNNFAKVPKEIIIDHNTFYNIGGGNNALIQINDPKDSTVTLSFTNNIVEKLYDPTNVRPFRLDPSAGTFDFNTNVFFDFMPTEESRMQYSLDSTVANQTNVTATGTITSDPQLLDGLKGDFRFPINSSLTTADMDGGQIGDPRWTEFEGVYLYEPEDIVFTYTPTQLKAAIILASGDTALNWTVENGYDGTSGAALINDTTGLLSPVLSGKVKVTATSEENGAYFDELIVSIQDSIHIDSVVLGVDGGGLPVINTKEGGLDLIATLYPSDPTNPNIEFSVSDESLAGYWPRSGGKLELEAIENGVLWVTVTTEDGGLQDSLAITITNQISVDSVEVEIDGGAADTISSIGGTLQLNAIIYPANADNQDVVWSANPESVAIVVDGLVTSVAEGTVTITVTTDDGSYQDSIDVHVVLPGAIAVESVEISIDGGASDTITTIGGTVQLIATITPDNATDQGVQWFVDPAGVVTVVDGLVTSVANGAATVTVTTDDGGKTDAIDIIVDVPTGIEENLMNQLRVLPNPANDFISLNVSQQSMVTIYNVVGNIVKNQILEVGGSIDISGLADGVYIVNAVIGDKVFTLRFVKE